MCSQQLDGVSRRVSYDGAGEPEEVDGWVDYWWGGLAPPVDALVVPMPYEPGRIRWLSAVRDSAEPFTEREQLIAGVLRPHLHDIWWQSRRAPDRVPRLTPREWEILHLVGEGLSNAEVAQRLFLSPATVRKHLEHVADKVGVRSRSVSRSKVLRRRPWRNAWPLEK